MVIIWNIMDKNKKITPIRTLNCSPTLIIGLSEIGNYFKRA